MGVFNTERVPNYEAKLESMIQTAHNRKKNLEALKESASANEHKAVIESKLHDIDNNTSALESYNREVQRDRMATNRANLLRSNTLMTLESKLFNKGMEQCYETAIFNIVYESFWADDVIKESVIPQLLESYRDTLTVLEKCGVKKTKESDETSFIKNVKEACCNTAKKASERIVKEISDDDDVESIDFSLNNDEATELDDNLASLGMDEVSELIKRKVVNVINDEMEASAKKSELFKEIDDNAKELEDELNSDTSETPEDEEEATESASFVQRSKTNRMNRLTGTSVFECIQMSSIRKVDNHIVTEGIKLNNDDVMDSAFMESVLTYTILETLQTLKLYNFNNSTVKALKEYYKTN